MAGSSRREGEVRVDPFLERFHETSRTLDLLAPMRSLLDGFRRGEIADRERTLEDAAMGTHLGGLGEAWERVFGSFPACPWRRRTLTWEYHRGRRDAYLRELIAAHLPPNDRGDHLIVNPAAVAGRHARFLARALPDHQVIGTDVDPGWNRLYRLAISWRGRDPENFRFEREDVFEPGRERRPVLVTFFGACGAVTDGCIDYALSVGAPFLVFRSCCHDNIAGNTEIVRRWGRPVNDFFAAKNFLFAREKRRNRGHYFSERYGPSAYPRSEAARALLDTETMLALARNAPESDVCRSLIDLDRCLHLRENGYDVLYREELFFAHRR